ncbi:MAG: hypothetical protein ACETVT_01005 [bacterium]
MKIIINLFLNGMAQKLWIKGLEKFSAMIRKIKHAKTRYICQDKVLDSYERVI